MRVVWPFALAALVSLHASSSSAQTPQSPNPDPDAPKRIFGIVPNYRTSPTLEDYTPLTAKEKLGIARDDAFDRGTFVLAALFAGDAQLTGADPEFGRGVPAYARYFAASTADWMIGDVMTEGIYPALLHQDPRYFRRGEGSGWSRLAYAMGQIFVTHTDAGGMAFNYSEIAGNATAVGISNAYYPGGRTWSNNAWKMGSQVGVDMASNVLKEFWPDLDRAWNRMMSRAKR